VKALATILLAAFALGPAAGANPQEPAPPAPIVAPSAPSVDDGVSPASAPDGGRGETLEESLRDLATPIRVLLLLSVLAFLPAALLTLTSFTRIVIVLSFIRRAIGAPELPPNPVLVGLSLALTAAVMAPSFGRIHDRAIAPYLEGEMTLPQAGEAAATTISAFLLKQTREEDLRLSLELARVERPRDAASVPFRVVVPAFVLSELRTAFRMGFLLFLPFVVIDLLVATVLLSLGMFMLPPVMLAMPLKILLFVLVDGWSLVVRSLAVSFAA
jgi:flagellar biosynthetic protein FliP